jgi:hypothetical protein
MREKGKVPRQLYRFDAARANDFQSNCKAMPKRNTRLKNNFCFLLGGALSAAVGSTPAFAQDASPTILRQGTRGEVLPELKLPSLVPNSDFTAGLKGWSVSRAAGVSAEVSAARVTDEHSKDESVLRVQKTGGIGVVRVVSERIPVQPNTEYILTGLYHTEDAKFGTLAEFRVLEIADADKPAAQDTENLTITGPTSPSHTGHFGVFNCRPGQWRRRTRTVRTGADTKFVRLALLVEGPPVTIFFDNLHFNLREKDTREWKFPPREVPLSREETERRLLQRPDSQAQVRQENGGPRLYLDGKPRVPFVHLSDVVNPLRGYVKEFAEAGMDLHMITLFNTTQKHWTGPGQYDFKKIDDLIWNSVQRDPEGYFIIYINVTAYPEWTQQFPEHTAMNAKGEPVTSRHGHFGPPSYYAAEYRRQVMDLLRAYTRHIKAQPYSRAVAGFMLGGGEDGQFYYQSNGQKTIQDGHSPGDLPLFRDWLRRRYKNDVQKLRAAWNAPDVTFETAKPRISSEKYSGAFFDPKTQGHELDVQRFLNDEVATLLAEGLSICKQEIGKPVIGVAYYGRGMSALVYPMFAQNSVIFQSAAVDMLGAQPGYYGWRETGNEGMLNWVFDSTRRHKKIPMLELDFRSWTSQYKDLWHDTQIVRYWNNEDMLGAMARDAGKVLSVGGGAWWMEMTGGWFHDPQIMDSLEKMQRAGQTIAAESGSWHKSEVVFVVDEENYFHTTEQLNIWNGPNYHSLAIQQRAINRAGVPYDLYYLDDLIADNRDDYKIYVFLNLYHADERARNFIETRLKRGDKTLVWQYAPGFVTENGLSVDGMKSLTGINFSADLKNSEGLGSVFSQAQTPLTKPMLAGVSGDKMGLGVDLWAPRFVVEDAAAQPLGNYLSDGKVSAAVKKLDGFTSVFIGPPSGLTPQFWRNVAVAGGATPFIEAGDMALFHRDNFIVVHGVEGGRKTLHLPFKAKVTEMLTGRVLAQNSDTIPLNIKIADTLWLHLER